MQIDHILVAVADLSDSARAVEQRLGVASVEGGQHPQWGTANRIVPLGDTYLELVAVVDGAAASRTAFGSWVARTTTERPRPMGWAVRVEHLEDDARRLGLAMTPAARIRADGRSISWRTAGIDVAASEPCLPFFIEWSDERDLPGRATVAHPVGWVRLAGLVIDGDPDRLATWLGDHRLPIEIRTGDAAIAEVILEHEGGQAVL